MAHFVKQPKRFDALNITLATSLYEYIGDGEEMIFSNTSVIGNINIKTILTKGSCLIEFPDTDESNVISLAPGPVFPGPKAMGKKHIKMTTLTDDVEVQCIQPYPGYKITVQSDSDYAPGTVDIEKGVLVFVFGDSYSINNDTYSDFHMFAIQNNNITINLINTARIVMFKAMPL